MSVLALYLLKANLLIILVFIGYFFGLRKLTFHKLNRYFLLLGLVCSLALPALNLPVLFIIQDVGSEKAIDQPSATQIDKAKNSVRLQIPIAEAQHMTLKSGSDEKEAAPVSVLADMDYLYLVGMVICVGVIVMGVRLLIQLLSLYNIYRSSLPAKYKDISYRLLGDRINPFSFWNLIFLNPSHHDNDEIPGILAHELIHVKQLHSLDVLFAEIVLVLFWYNPAAWLKRSVMKENLEYLTDQQLIDDGIDIKRYQYSLLSTSNVSQQPSIVNNFNFLTLKNRIAMMNQPKSSSKQMMRYAMVLPVLIAAPFVVNISKAESNDVRSLTVDKPSITENIHQFKRDQTSSHNQSIKGTNNVRQNSSVQTNDDVQQRNQGIPNLNIKNDASVALVSKELITDTATITVKSAQEQHHANYTPSRPLMTRPDTVGGVPMVVINGKEATWNQFEAIPLSRITSITHLKGAITSPDRKDKLKNGLMLVSIKP